MHNVSASNAIPSILDMLKPPQSKGVVQARIAPGSKTTDSSSGTSAADLQTTFLNLLSTELQNQDPTNPVDSTAMVGQMISLNQLDQLVSINQAVTGNLAANAANQKAPNPASATTATLPATGAAAKDAASASNSLPFDPNTMMPWANSTLASTLLSGFNPAALGLSGINNHSTGGR